MDTFEKIIQLSEERPITPSSLFLVGQLLGKSRFIKKCNTMKVDSKRSQNQIKNGDILLCYIGLLCQGKTAYEDIRKMLEDHGYYERALGITSTIPSAETLRQRMDGMISVLLLEGISLMSMLKCFIPITWNRPQFQKSSFPLTLMLPHWIIQRLIKKAFYTIIKAISVMRQ